MLTTADVACRQALDCLPVEARALAQQDAYLMPVKHGQRIVQAGVMPAGAMFVVKGAMAVSSKPKVGIEVVMCFARPQIWQVGHLLAADVLPVYDSFAVGRAEIVVWPREAFVQAYQAHKSLRDYIRDCEVLIQACILKELQQSLALTLPQRLARRLLQLADLVGAPVGDKAVKLTAPVSHALLASSLGVSRQRIHSQLRDWAALGWLDSSYRDVILHAPEQLRTAAAFAA
jgi:CRP-like cAMP-binding protein